MQATNPLVSTLPVAIGFPSPLGNCSSGLSNLDELEATLYAVEDWPETEIKEFVLAQLAIEGFDLELAEAGRTILGQGTYDQCKALCKAWRLDKPLRRTLIVIPRPGQRPLVSN